MLKKGAKEVKLRCKKINVGMRVFFKGASLTIIKQLDDGRLHVECDGTAFIVRSHEYE